jgi:hypothetical protein
MLDYICKLAGLEETKTSASLHKARKQASLQNFFFQKEESTASASLMHMAFYFVIDASLQICTTIFAQKVNTCTR